MSFFSAPPLPSFRKLPSTPPYFRKLFVKQPIWQSPPLSTSNTSWLLTDKLQINSHPNEVLIKKIPTPWTFPNLLETGNIFETLWWWKLIYNFCWTVSHVVLCQERGVSNIWRQGFSTCQMSDGWKMEYIGVVMQAWWLMIQWLFLVPYIYSVKTRRSTSTDTVDIDSPLPMCGYSFKNKTRQYQWLGNSCNFRDETSDPRHDKTRQSPCVSLI